MAIDEILQKKKKKKERGTGIFRLFNTNGIFSSRNQNLINVVRGSMGSMVELREDGVSCCMGYSL